MLTYFDLDQFKKQKLSVQEAYQVYLNSPVIYPVGLGATFIVQNVAQFSACAIQLAFLCPLHPYPTMSKANTNSHLYSSVFSLV